MMTLRLDHKITRSGDHRQIRDQTTRSRSFEPEKSARGSGAPLPRAGLTHRSDSRRQTAVEEMNEWPVVQQAPVADVRVDVGGGAVLPGWANSNAHRVLSEVAA